MATADLYLRLSLDYEGATSIDRQEVDCRRWCTANGVTVRRVHVDRGVSGFSETAHRDGFDAALVPIVTAEVATLVVWSWTACPVATSVRWARSSTSSRGPVAGLCR